MKTLILIVFTLTLTIQAQDINAKLGGNTSNETYDVTDSDDNLLFRVQGDGNVGIGTTNPLSKLSVGGDGISSATIYGETDYGRGVYGYATNFGDVQNYGGFFEAAGSSGRGVYGIATNSGSVWTNWGGYFQAAGQYGRGVYGGASGSFGYGVYGRATNSGAVTNYGGRFEAEGSSGRGVYGSALNSGAVTNYGGYFLASGSSGRGVYGEATNSGSGIINYGGYFVAKGRQGRGVYGFATYTGTGLNIGGYFQAAGPDGRGVLGYATGSSGQGVRGYGVAYDFYAANSGSVNYGSVSSIRWKNNIVEIDNPLEKLSEIRGVYFNWDEEHGGGHDIGCIAEEVGKVLPEIVVYEENGVDADGMDYSKLTPLLIEAIKALQKRVEELESR